MKTIQIFKIFSWAILLLMLMGACENDGDKIYLTTPDANDFIITGSEVLLSTENSQKVVLSLAWNESVLGVSDPSVSATDVLTTSIQISTENDFSSNIAETLELGLSKAYLGSELNSIAKNLGIEPGVETPVYFRLAVRTGNNMPVYSDAKTVMLTSYFIDMSKGFILDADKVETGRTLSSPEMDGIYKGFMGASGWYNYYLMEGDGTIWGNDGVSGTPFLLSSENDSEKRWNFWFPGITGCYFTEVNTISKRWSALLLPTLTVSGDIEADMTFDRPNVRWTTTFNATAASTLRIKLSSAGKLYDYTTNTNDDAAKNTPVAFVQSGEYIAMASQAGDISVTVPKAGDFTLIVDLSDPDAWICKVEEGTSEPEPVIQYLYLPGIDDKISGSWTFDNYLKLYDENELKYAGVFNVGSQYGYTINIEKDNWDDKYNMAEGDAYSGILRFKGENNNISAPADGLYLIDASLIDFSYNLTALGNQIYVLGLHDLWNFDIPLTLTATPGVYSGPITINSASPWGFTINLKNGDRNLTFGGSAGKLYYKGDNIKDDATLEPGTYQLTADLINETYTITQ